MMREWMCASMADGKAAPKYSLALSEQERGRFRMMAASAADNEAAEWEAAGITAGARVADIGCGPGAVLQLLAETVGPRGVAQGIDADPETVEMANEEIAAFPHARASVGQADATGLPAASFDVVMCRLVLAHNGGREQAIVDHLASLVVPGGCVYLADVDFPSSRSVGTRDRDVDDLIERWSEFHAARGSDPEVGLHLGDLLMRAGLVVERFVCRAPVIRMPPGMRPAAWAAVDAMIAEGFATQGDKERWAAGLARLDSAAERPWTFIASFVALGRRH